MYWHMCFLLIQHNQEKQPMSPDPFLLLWVGSGDEISKKEEVKMEEDEVKWRKRRKRR